MIEAGMVTLREPIEADEDEECVARSFSFFLFIQLSGDYFDATTLQRRRLCFRHYAVDEGTLVLIGNSLGPYCKPKG